MNDSLYDINLNKFDSFERKSLTRKLFKDSQPRVILQKYYQVP